MRNNFRLDAHPLSSENPPMQPGKLTPYLRQGGKPLDST